MNGEQNAQILIYADELPQRDKCSFKLRNIFASMHRKNDSLETSGLGDDPINVFMRLVSFEHRLERIDYRVACNEDS